MFSCVNALISPSVYISPYHSLPLYLTIIKTTLTLLQMLFPNAICLSLTKIYLSPYPYTCF